MSNQFSKGLRAFAEDHIWVNDHLESLLDEYAEQWIAVKNRRVIASDVDLTLLREKLADPAHTCVEFVTREPLEMLPMIIQGYFSGRRYREWDIYTQI